MGGERNGVGRRAFIKKAVKTSGAIYIAPTVASIAVSTRVGAQVTPPSQVVPRLVTITPNFGPTAGGTVVTITGSGFQVGSTVFFGGVPATGVTVISPTQIQATTPPGAAGPVTVTVANPGGMSGSIPMGFTYIAPGGGGAAPTVGTVTPGSGPTTGGTPITITGTNFRPGATVTVGGAPATGVTVVNPTTITATTPPGAVGTAPVTVTNMDGTTGTLPMGFTFRLFASTARAFTASGTAAPLLALGEVALSTLPPGGTNTTAGVTAAPLLTTGIGTNTTTNTSTPTQAGATATSTITNPAIGSIGIIPIGAITASMITVNASSTATGTTATSTGATTITGLTAGGVPILVTGAPNQTVPITLPVVGTVGTLIVNEQVPTGNGTTTTGITVNALRFTATAIGAGIPVGASVIVGSASTTASAA